MTKTNAPRKTTRTLQTAAMDSIQAKLNAICDRANDSVSRDMRASAQIEIDFAADIGLITSMQKFTLYEQFDFALRLASLRPTYNQTSEAL
jgi:hypothetical protein